MKTKLSFLTVLISTLPTAIALAQPIIIKSDASTLAAATTNFAALDSGNGGLMGFATRPTDSARCYFRVRQP